MTRPTMQRRLPAPTAAHKTRALAALSRHTHSLPSAPAHIRAGRGAAAWCHRAGPAAAKHHSRAAPGTHSRLTTPNPHPSTPIHAIHKHDLNPKNYCIIYPSPSPHPFHPLHILGKPRPRHSRASIAIATTGAVTRLPAVVIHASRFL
ncbi:hypothetical protein E2C01_057898 [Portunus trituberculatus]|uniref:Uncharacterized protein n=1 Tax=Portunus trituberculatus TaxID=210409 RepID=A0A5B7H2C7_PORTR|nr:hypothetical protein [Portunus trituberculatus]